MKGEKRFEMKVRKYLEEQGCYVVKFFANSYTKAGVPDLCCCVNGYSIWLEIKDTNGKPSELQLYNRDKIREAGGIAIILYPEDFEEFKRLINNIKTKVVCGSQYIFDRGGKID